MKLRVRRSAVGARHVVPLQPRHHQYASAIIEFAGGRRQIREKSGLAGFAKTRNWKVIENTIVRIKPDWGYLAPRARRRLVPEAILSTASVWI